MYVKIDTNWYKYFVLTLSKLVIHCTVKTSTSINRALLYLSTEVLFGIRILCIDILERMIFWKQELVLPSHQHHTSSLQKKRHNLLNTAVLVIFRPKSWLAYKYFASWFWKSDFLETRVGFTITSTLHIEIEKTER